jgi:hypothetical protein
MAERHPVLGFGESKLYRHAQKLMIRRSVMQSTIFVSEEDAGCLQRTLAIYSDFHDVNTDEDNIERSLLMLYALVRNCER